MNTKIGSNAPTRHIDFLYYPQRYGYNGILTADTSPTGWDIKGNFETNARLSRKIWSLLEELDPGEIEDLINGGDYIKTWEFIETRIYSL